MASEDDYTSDSLDVSVTKVPESFMKFVQSKVAEYIAQAKDITAHIHHLKGQPPKLVLTFGCNEEAKPSSHTDVSQDKTRTLFVKNLPPLVDEDLLVAFFESTKKYGGGPVKSVKILEDEHAALVEFTTESAIQTILKKKPIKFGKTELDIQPCDLLMQDMGDLSHVDVKNIPLPKEFTDSLLAKEIQKLLIPAYGPKLAELLKVGSRVVRGKDWQYGNQDGNCTGTVVQLPEDLTKESVRVTWDNGHSNNYRMGMAGKYELKLAEEN